MKKLEEGLKKYAEKEDMRSMKKVFMSISYTRMMRLFDNKVLLGQGKVEKGKVYIVPICKFGKYNFSLLELAPESKIAFHMHTKDNEQYVTWRNKIPEACLKGNGHELENTSKEKSLYVLSIKY